MFATARKLATLIYRMLRYGQEYVDTGEQAHEAKYANAASPAFASQLGRWA